MDPALVEQRIQRELRAFQDILQNEPFPESYSPNVRCVLTTVHEYLFETYLNVNWVLDACEIRSNTFRSEFKFHCQTTLRRYIEDKRLMAAMALLTDEDLDVTLIARHIGYASHRSFARAFKRYVGCSSSEFRENMAARPDPDRDA